MRSATFYALAAANVVAAVHQGFNYGSTQTDGSIKSQADFLSEFQTAQTLVGTSGFTSARLYTMIQAGTANTPISAIPAAISSKTTLLLGLWASGGQTGMDNEIAALKAAIAQYGTAFTSLVTGISVGSEDLYRISPTGIAALSGYGEGPATLVSYISQVRAAIAGTALSGASIGHVDTWTAWVNGSNSAVVSAVDWVGMDAYPYFQSTQANSVANGKALFYDAYDATVAVSGGKDVWITETGWPVSGSVSGQAVASLANAKTYWDEVGCASFGKVNTYWFTLQDAFPTTPNPSFGIVGSTLTTTPLFDLSCSAASSSSSSASATRTSASSGAASATSASSAANASIISSAQSVASAQTGAQAPSGMNGVGSSARVSASSAAHYNGTVVTTAAGGVPTTITSVRATVTTGSAAGTGAAGAGSATTSARSTGYTGAAVKANTGSFLGAVGAIAVAAIAL